MLIHHFKMRSDIDSYNLGGWVFWWLAGWLAWWAVAGWVGGWVLAAHTARQCCCLLQRHSAKGVAPARGDAETPGAQRSACQSCW